MRTRPAAAPGRCGSVAAITSIGIIEGPRLEALPPARTWLITALPGLDPSKDLELVGLI
jgi:hypothetical protein